MMFISQALLALSLTAAQPTPDQVKAVFDHYYSGKGLILAEAYLCTEIDKKKGETKNDCVTRAGASVKKGDSVEVYLTFLMPKGDEQDLMVQAVHEGIVRSTKDVKAKSYGMRSRTWRTFTLGKEGKWEFKVLSADGKELTKLSIDAT